MHCPIGDYRPIGAQLLIRRCATNHKPDTNSKPINPTKSNHRTFPTFASRRFITPGSNCTAYAVKFKDVGLTDFVWRVRTTPLVVDKPAH